MVSPELIVSAFGAAGVGTIVGHLLAVSKDRREARARVFEVMARVETARWGAESLRGLRHLIHESAAAMLLAQVPRDAARRYLVLAYACALMSEETENEMGESFVDMELANLTQDAAGLVTLLVWHPWWGRIAAMKKRPTLAQTATKLRERGASIAGFVEQADELAGI
jgi:hypothetical protein